MTERKNTETGSGETATRAMVIHPVTRHASRQGRTPEHCLEEAAGLARAIGLHVVWQEIIRLGRPPTAATFLGSGAVVRLAETVQDHAIALVFVDCTLSPVQQRNLEKALATKVIDRTGLIIDIFGARARTHEGRLQVELAALTWQRSRLVRSWTHLERQRGGLGFVGGPGESQLEIDRRLIDRRIVTLNRELDAVKRTRGLHRRARVRAAVPLVVLVGYTNAGKSTLFNRLSGAQVIARDRLFATLDPTMRWLELPSGARAVLSDTVGFIADLPADLTTAFRATLEELRAADLILHVRDIAGTDTDAEMRDVVETLEKLELNPEIPLIEAWNKADLLSSEVQATCPTPPARPGRPTSPVLISARTGAGIDALLRTLDAALFADRVARVYHVPPEDGAALAWLYRHGAVLEREDGATHCRLRVTMAAADAARFESDHQAFLHAPTAIGAAGERL